VFHVPVGIQLFQSCQIVLAGLVAMAALGASARAETRFGDWELVCPPNGSQQAEIKPGNAGIDVVGGKSTCRLQQAQAANAGRDIVFLFNIVRQDKRNVAVVSVPLGVYLPAGLELRVDGGKARRAVFEACNLTGCHAGFADGINCCCSRVVENNGFNLGKYFTKGGNTKIKYEQALI